MNKLLVVLIAALVAGCSVNNVPAPVVTPTPQVIYVPSPSESNLVPGSSALKYPWTWAAQGIGTKNLEEELLTLKTPDDIEKLFFAKYVWKDDYDTREFLSPNSFNERKRGVCSAFARYWQEALGRQGIKGDFVAFWSPSFAHAVTVFRGKDVDGQTGWFMGSNRSLVNDADQDLNPGNPGNDGRENAWVGSAEFFVGDTWTKIQVYDENGKIVWEKNSSKTPNESAVPGNLSRNIFTFKEDL